MALFKISKGKSANLPTNKVDGYCYVTTNDHKFYVDYTKDDGTLDRFALNAVTADTALSVAWGNITGKPSTYAPSSHTHTIANITNLQSTLDAKVPTSRTINGKALSSNITLSASDVGADIAGSASSALSSAKSYTDAEIAEWVGDQPVPTQISNIKIGGRNLLKQYIKVGNACTKIDNLTVKVGTSLTDTHFYLRSHCDLVAGETYTMSCEASNVPSGCNWSFGIRTQGSKWQLYINKNGKNFATGVLDVNISADTDFILDDLYGRPSTAPNIILTNFKLEKGNKATDWTPAPEDVQSAIDSKANESHTHNYAGSSSAGGSANSAVKLDSSAGSATQPIYFSGGKPTQCNSTLGVSISGNAATATKATKDGNGNTISSTYLPLSAGESKKLTGPLGLTENVNYGTSLPSSGFTGQLFFLEDVSQDDLPIASATVNGIVTTGTQTFAGNKTFNNNVYFGANGSYGYVDSSGVHGAIWNDYAEFRVCNEDFKPGQVVLENGNDTLSITNQRLQRGCSIVSDTFGFVIGETDKAKCPIAVSGRVLAYGYESREEFKKHIGWPVCSGPNGTVSIMTEEEEEKYSSRIIGTVSAVPDYETWGTGNIEVNNRIWIKVK